MRQSWIGIRVSAVLTILGSLITLLMAFGALWTAFHAFEQAAQAPSPLPLRGIMVGVSILFILFSVWGVSTAISVFRRRAWARLSMIVFALLMVGMGGSALVGILFIRMPENPSVPAQTMQYARVGIAAVYGAMTVIGAWWLLLFNSAATKEYFASRAPLKEGGRPLSITIIGWYLLVCALFTAVGAILRVPSAMFGVVITGWAALGIYTVFTAVEIYLGTGLLQLQEAARAGSIIFFGLIAANALATALLPGAEQRMQAMEEAMPAFLQTSQVMPQGTGAMMSMGALFALLPIWFLVRRRAEFRR